MAIAIGKTPLSTGVKFEVIWYILLDLCMLKSKMLKSWFFCMFCVRPMYAFGFGRPRKRSLNIINKKKPIQLKN